MDCALKPIIQPLINTAKILFKTVVAMENRSNRGEYRVSRGGNQQCCERTMIQTQLGYGQLGEYAQGLV